MNTNDLNNLIKNRRSISPASYTDKPIEKEVLMQILENANWAPNHAKTEPWRFRVYQGEALTTLGDGIAAAYKKNTPEERFKELTYNKFKKNPIKSACAIALCMVRDEKERIPEWEEVAAVSCAVQNMWLTATAHNIGAYWSSPGSVLKSAEDFITLGEREKCLGFFFMGHHELPQVEGVRGNIEDKITWM